MLGSRDRQRATFAWKTGGLGASDLQVTLGNSTITLGGLVKHLALVEDYYFSVRLFGHAHSALFDSIDFDEDSNWDWSSAAQDDPSYLYGLWQRMVDQSRRLVAEAIADGGLEHPMKLRWPDGRSPSLRRTLVDLIEEYARHVGHADLIRESIDGLVGEDPSDVHDDPK